MKRILLRREAGAINEFIAITTPNNVHQDLSLIVREKKKRSNS